jgi:hypothetical protein
MKKYFFSSVFLMLVGLMVSAQCAPGICTGPVCTKSSTGKDGVCTKACAAKVCTSGNANTASLWSGKIDINGKSYFATGKIYNAGKETTASLSIPGLKIANEIFVISRSNNSTYSLVPKSDLGFIGNTKSFQ